jgi:AmmeMemoRadiSam system protein A
MNGGNNVWEGDDAMSEFSATRLGPAERRLLLELARQSIITASENKPLPSVDIDEMPPCLKEYRACFVTLHKDGMLRGCTGVLVARSPLVYEVIQTAAQTALQDPRFLPVMPGEADSLDIEISVLTPTQPLILSDPEELPHLIRPGIDGVTLSKNARRATFLPQVWERVPDPVIFLNMLCRKMGFPPNEWRFPGMSAEVYQVEQFSDQDPGQK